MYMFIYSHLFMFICICIFKYVNINIFVYIYTNGKIHIKKCMYNIIYMYNYIIYIYLPRKKCLDKLYVKQTSLSYLTSMASAASTFTIDSMGIGMNGILW